MSKLFPLTQLEQSRLNHILPAMELREAQEPGWYTPKYFFPELLNYVASRRTDVENIIHLKDLPRAAAGETGVRRSPAVNGV